MKKGARSEVKKMGPLKVAHLNGLSVSRQPMHEEIKDEPERASNDERVGEPQSFSLLTSESVREGRVCEAENKRYVYVRRWRFVTCCLCVGNDLSMDKHNQELLVVWVLCRIMKEKS